MFNDLEYDVEYDLECFMLSIVSKACVLIYIFGYHRQVEEEGA